MYDLSSTLIAGILFASMALAIELGHRVGRRYQRSSDEPSKSHIITIQGSLIGILALLLGFTFSLSLQRFDSRSEAVVSEANAIGTAYLRAQLLPESVRAPTLKALASYLSLRVRAGSLSLDHAYQRQAMLDQATQQQALLWNYALQAAEEVPNPVTSGLFLQALNEMIDAYGTRDATLNRHVPEIVLNLLYTTFLMAGVILGYSSGVAGHRASFATYIMVGLIVLLVFLIIDLDRPRRGLIQVSHKSLTDLESAMARPRQVTPFQEFMPGSAAPR
ncbi:hypothetical protein FBY03_109157 [Pseudomonas sp. SJZ079]|uniref:bestrophin-like domain n=1 Tax=Pseudomonas sp. SJZ079 TaxID=2572887 RepID=UPI00119AE727|nr:hypothetical protein [Pseudomonas sp. SJZ079]TWC36319.1 hypothetical protein FBY03_109157 [Pseudomonas sp. SJZ079]